MIKFDDIILLIERCKTPYVQVTDHHGNKIISVENTTVNATVKELQDIEPMLRAYGKLEVKATDAAGAKANYKGAYKWVMVWDKPGQTNMMGMMPPGMMQPQQTWGAPAGFVSVEVMNAKLDALKKESEMEKRLADLERKHNDNGPEKYMGYMPAVMSIMGHDDAKIEKMVRWAAMSKGMSNVAFKPPTNTLTFKDVEQMSPEEKNAKIQTLLDSLASKVSAEHMILLLEAIDKRPELAEKAVGMLSMI